MNRTAPTQDFPCRAPAPTSAPRERLPILDVMRFVAASGVVIYHMTYRPQESALFGSLQAVTKYGYLGVDLFFIISGFVILWSATGRSVADYLISRVARLYPSFWVAILVTSAALLLLRPERLPSPRTVVANLSMLPGYFGAGYVDGVYWTLAVELKFYLLVLLCLVFRQMARVEWWLWAWLALTVACHVPHMPHAVASLVIFPYGAFFIAGSLFYLTWRDGPSVPRFVGLLICLGLTGVAAVNDRAGFMHDISPASAWVVVAVLCMVFALFGAIALRAVGQLRSRVWFLLGTLTYPLYLIHNEVGKAVFYAVGAQVSAWSRLVVTLTVIGVISWLMAVIVERRASPALRRLLTRAQARAT